jgi:ABC-type phosphate/phosphonate transport system permease subunit
MDFAKQKGSYMKEKLKKIAIKEWFNLTLVVLLMAVCASGIHTNYQRVQTYNKMQDALNKLMDVNVKQETVIDELLTLIGKKTAEVQSR